MPTEPNLPTELNEIEMLLQHFSPTDSAINRDELLYQAGWAAAETRTKLTTHWIWPITSGVLAASLLLLVTLPQASPLQRTESDRANPTKQVQQLTTDPPTRIMQAQPIRTFAAPLRRYSPAAPLFVMRTRALRQDFDVVPTDSPIDEYSTSTDKTSRQLLREFLPDVQAPRSSNSERLRFWSRWNLGETS